MEVFNLAEHRVSFVALISFCSSAFELGGGGEGGCEAVGACVSQSLREHAGIGPVAANECPAINSE